MDPTTKAKAWRWRKKRFLILLVIFVSIILFIDIINVTISINPINKMLFSHPIAIIYEFMIIFSACTHRSEKGIFKRILWIIILFIAPAILGLSYIFLLFFVANLFPFNVKEFGLYLEARIVILFVTFPILIFAMSRSKYFVVANNRSHLDIGSAY